MALGALVPASWETHGPTSGMGLDIERVVVLDAWVGQSVLGITLAGSLLVLVLLIRHILGRRYLMGAVCGGIFIFGLPISICLNLFENESRWTLHDWADGPDGNRYCFLDTSFLQGQIMVLGRLESDSFMGKTFSSLGATNGDSPQSWASVIRPQGALDLYGQLYFTKNNVLLGIRFENRCYLAYDFSGKGFLGHGNIEGLSPFLLVEDGPGIHGSDIDRIKDYITKVCAEDPDCTDRPGVPLRRVLVEELKHTRPEIREIAQDLLRLYPPEKGE
jgi:hypothetical protein